MTSGTPAVELVTLTDADEVRAAGEIFRTAMVGLPPLPDGADGLVEPGRTLGARLDGRLVGAVDSYTSWLVVPGGQRLPHAADIVDRIVVTFAPVDSPLRHLFTDERVVTVASVHDETWLRLVDVPTALARRSYHEAPPVVLEVTDDLLPANTGPYRIAADAVTRVDAPADLTTDVAALAAVYLGGSTWQQLALAGRVRENRSGAIEDADNLFTTISAPFAGTYF
jgi:hypothetical protein